MKSIDLNLKDTNLVDKVLSNITDIAYLIPTKIYNQLLQLDLPIERELAIEQICKFIDHLMNIYWVNDKSAFEISKKVFVSIFSIHTYNQFKAILKDLKILTNVPHENGVFYNYEEGICKKYRIHNEYLDLTDYTIVLFEQKRKNEIVINDNITFELDQRFIDTIKTETIDKVGAFKEQMELYNAEKITTFGFILRVSRIYNLDKSRYIKQGNRVNRIYHSFSTLDKVSRRHLTTKFYEIDLTNAQPVLLAIFLKDHLTSLDESFQNYIKDCETGNFYEQLMEEGDDRDEIKRKSYQCIFFKFIPESKINKKFKKLYPIVWEKLNQLNDECSIESFAIELQNLEADLFNNIKVEKSSKYFTLHDAIYFNNKKDAASINKQIKNYGKKYKMKLATKLKINEPK